MRTFNIPLSWSAMCFFVLMPVFGVAADQKTGHSKQPAEARDTAQPKKGTEADTIKNGRPKSPPVYTPPLRGAPGGRVGGGSRQPNDTLPTVYPLAPDHVGLTLQNQPTLYWYLSKSTAYPIEFTFIEEDGVKPLLEEPIQAVSEPGIQEIRLGDYSVQLELGVVYRWFVAVIVDPESRSKDVLGGGLIERIDLPRLDAALAPRDGEETIRVYAEAGIWYDALSTVSKMMDASANHLPLRQQRAALLDQVGLTEVSKHERQVAALN